MADDPTIWILVHEDFNYPLFYRPDPTLTIGPYLFTREKAAIEAAYAFPSDIVVARPGRVSQLFDEMAKDHEFTDGFVLDPSMNKGFTLYEGIIPLTEIGALFADHLLEEEFWGLLDPFTLRRFALDVMKKRTGMEPMD